MKNRFKFYEGKGSNKDVLKATKEIIKETKNFKIRIREILNKYYYIGATDTQSREEVYNFVIEQIKGGF